MDIKDKVIVQEITRKEEDTATQKTSTEVDFPEKFKLYEQGIRTVVCKKTQRTPNILGEACDRPLKVKEINLRNGVDPKPVFIAMNL